MPPPPTQAQIDQVAPYLSLQGVPTAMVSGFWAAIEAAGLTVVDQTTGLPVEAAASTPGELVLVDGMRQTYLAGIKVGERGWLLWAEIYSAAGITRTTPVFAPGAGSLLTAAARADVFTVGTSAVGGTDGINYD